MVSSLATKLSGAATAAGITRIQRQFVAMMGAQAEAVDADGVKYTLLLDGIIKATIIRRYGPKIMKETEREVVKKNDNAQPANKVKDTNMDTVQGKPAFNFKSNVKPKAPAAPPKAQAQAAPAASKAQAAPVQPKPKAMVMPKVNKNTLSATQPMAGRRAYATMAKVARLERSASPSSDRSSSSASSGASFVAMETSFPPLSLPAKKEPRGPLPGQADGKEAANNTLVEGLPVFQPVGSSHYPAHYNRDDYFTKADEEVDMTLGRKPRSKG